ncbi:MAG: glycoside hydrolase family 13 protein [Oscillospiraceae bacterium]|nr:glycoside hydrolase family 13 protein [Oscillospiraceae bacterium]
MNVFNSRDEFFKSPFGAVKQNTHISFSVALDSDDDKPYLSIQRETAEKQKLAMSLKGKENGKFIFTVSFVPQERGLYFYSFKLGDSDLGIYNSGKGNGYVAEKGELFQLTVYDKDFSTPQQAKGKIFYQIFPDRFYEGKKKNKLSFIDRVYRPDKEGEPFFYPTEMPEGYLNKDYYGGDLKGITEKLDYLLELGVGYIYLNPIFESHSNHRYNTADYMKIDPDLGTLEDFHILCNAAHEKGIKIILDGVFSHTGSDSIYFNKEGRYDSKGAFDHTDSPYRKWYDFSPRFPCGYRAWWGFDTLPEVNEKDPSYIEFICGKGGVIDYWLSQGADGFRLDVADELPDSFIDQIRVAVKAHGEDKLLVGEVWEDATTKWSYGKRRRYLLGTGLDTTMNYPFRVSILNFLKDGNGGDFCDEIFTICENYPKEALDVALNNLSTHDTPRAMTALCGENPYSTDRYWQSKRFLTAEKYIKAQKLIVCGFALLFAMPGLPCIYYGDEIGMQGYRDPFNRGYFTWWAMDEYILKNVKKIAEFRNSHDVFAEGRIHFVFATDDCVVFTRFDRKLDKEVLIAVNRGVKDIKFEYNGKNYTVPAMYYLMENIK